MNHWDKNESLKRALEESLNEQIRMVPPKEQIENEFKFSKSFEHDMELIIKKRKRKKHHYFMKIAACAALLIGLSYTVSNIPSYNHSSMKNAADTKEDLKVNENGKSTDKKNETSFAESETGEKSFSMLEGTEENKTSERETEKGKEETNLQKTEEIITEKREDEDVGKKDETVLGNSKDETDITKASLDDGEHLGIVSRFLSASAEGDTIKVTIQIDNQTDTNITCEMTSSLQAMEEEGWIELTDSEGVITDEEKEVLAGETYEDTILITGFSLETGKQYKIIKMIAGEKQEFVFNL